MATAELADRPAFTVKDFKGPVEPDWCPGCGDFGVLRSLKQAAVDLGKTPHEIVAVSGIGCSSNLPGYIHAYGMHTLHGRSLPVATGLQLANHKLTVVVTGGDGDGYGIGANHLLHTMRRNVDLLYIVMNNQIYGLTTGQLSPTSEQGMITKSSPDGSIEAPLNPLAMAIAGGATWIGRGFSGDPKHLTGLMKAGMEHTGFALLDVFSPCVTYNHNNTFAWFKERVTKLEDNGHDPSDWKAAMEQSFIWGDEIPTGLFFENTKKPALHELDPVLDSDEPLAHRALGIPAELGKSLVDELL